MHMRSSSKSGARRRSNGDETRSFGAEQRSRPLRRQRSAAWRTRGWLLEQLKRERELAARDQHEAERKAAARARVVRLAGETKVQELMDTLPEEAVMSIDAGDDGQSSVGATCDSVGSPRIPPTDRPGSVVESPPGFLTDPAQADEGRGSAFAVPEDTGEGETKDGEPAIESSSSEDEDDADAPLESYFAVAGRTTNTERTEADAIQQRCEALARRSLRSRPTSPASWENWNLSWTDVESGIRLPLYSCPFRQCYYHTAERQQFL